jgi:hypothetical protein
MSYLITPGVSKLSSLQYTRTSEPTSQNTRYVSINYGGYNRCIPKDEDGYVLPNCTGYCWGRALETMWANDCDLSINNADTWFEYNKYRWDNQIGGYPYIDFKNLKISKGVVGFTEDMKLSNANQLKKMINSGIVTPGSIICYEEGINKGWVANYKDEFTGIYQNYSYPSPGHLMTIEGCYNWGSKLENEKSVEKIKAGLKTTLAVILGTMIGVSASKRAFIKLWSKLATLYDIYTVAGAPSALDAAIAKYVAMGWNITTMSNPLTGGQMRMFWETVYYLYKGVCYTAGLVVGLQAGILAGKTIDELLQEYEPPYYCVFRTTESNVENHSNFVRSWEDVNVGLQEWIDTGSKTDNIQGIIILPIKIKPTAQINKTFPWQLGNNIGLYD